MSFRSGPTAEDLTVELNTFVESPDVECVMSSASFAGDYEYDDGFHVALARPFENGFTSATMTYTGTDGGSTEECRFTGYPL